MLLVGVIICQVIHLCAIHLQLPLMSQVNVRSSYMSRGILPRRQVMTGTLLLGYDFHHHHLHRIGGKHEKLVTDAQPVAGHFDI